MGGPGRVYPTKTGLLPVLCALSIHVPTRWEQTSGIGVRQTCQRCGAYRDGVGSIPGRVRTVRRWTDPED